jgi:hypothetical protein
LQVVLLWLQKAILATFVDGNEIWGFQALLKTSAKPNSHFWEKMRLKALKMALAAFMPHLG